MDGGLKSGAWFDDGLSSKREAKTCLAIHSFQMMISRRCTICERSSIKDQLPLGINFTHLREGWDGTMTSKARR